MKRILSLFLLLTMLISLFPVSAYAEEQEPNRQPIPLTCDSDFPENDELFAGYVEQVLYGSASAYGTAGGRRLTGDCKKIYNALVPVLKQIADGQRSSTIIEVKADFTQAPPTGDQVHEIIHALMFDLPYELYWFDKSTGYTYMPIVSSSGITESIEFGFVVADNYKISDYETDVTKASAAKKAVANAKTIVSRYKSESDYTKLKGYMTTIRELTEYDYNYGDHAIDNSPWQLIHVFDGDPSTKVVCEGYAKAFQYLCDLSDFSGDTSSYIVTGTMGGLPHMWNIVSMKGRNYLVDVTNNHNGTDAFLIGGSKSSSDNSYYVKIGNMGVIYAYDDSSLSLWGTGSDSILNLSECGYTKHTYGNWKQTKAPTVSSKGSQERVCKICGKTETESIPVLKVKAPTVEVTVKASSGKPQLKWKSVSTADSYRVYRATSKSGTYSYLKSTSSTTFTDTSAKLNTKYYYKVRSYNKEIDKLSGYSNTVSQRCVLKCPAVTMKVDTASGKPKLTWDKVSGAVGYWVVLHCDGGSTWYSTTSTTFIHRQAEAGVEYSYTVIARHKNSAADSADSKMLSRVCDLAKPVVSITRKNGDPRITWKAIPGAAKYYVYRATSKDGKYTKVKTTVTARSYTDTSAKAGKTYYYKVKAIHSNTEASSAYSAVKSITAK